MNKELFEPLSKEDYKNIMEYYHQHSIFHNPEQAIRDLEQVKDILTKLTEEYLDNLKKEDNEKET